MASKSLRKWSFGPKDLHHRSDPLKGYILDHFQAKFHVFRWKNNLVFAFFISNFDLQISSKFDFFMSNLAQKRPFLPFRTRFLPIQRPPKHSKGSIDPPGIQKWSFGPFPSKKWTRFHLFSQISSQIFQIHSESEYFDLFLPKQGSDPSKRVDWPSRSIHVKFGPLWSNRRPILVQKIA